jgi:hypothetical protein
MVRDEQILTERKKGIKGYFEEDSIERVKLERKL